APLHGSGSPCDLQPAADGRDAVAAAKRVLPAQALLFDGGGLGFGADVLGRLGSAVGFPECVTAGNQRNGLLVIHRHAGEGLADILRGREWIRLAVRPFRIDINETHLYGSERIVELTFAAVALVRQPLPFRPPENI